MEEENSNDLLILGISILGLGLILAYYSLSSYLEVKNLNDKIDFDSIAYNNEISNVDKYYKYLSIDDYIEQNLKKNKNIPIKNISCVYLDYAQRNTLELYTLTNKKLNNDESKKNIAAGTIRKLYNTLDYYKTCKQTETYKQELKNILKEIEQSQNLYSDYDQRMDEFINSNNELPHSETSEQYPQTTSDYYNRIPQDLPEEQATPQNNYPAY